MLYAYINENLTVGKRREFPEGQEFADHKLRADGGLYWRPYVTETVDNSTTEHTKVEHEVVVHISRVVHRTTISDMTQAEVDAAAEKAKDDALARTENLSVSKALAKALFEVLNDVRELKGQQPVTPAQFKSYLRSKL